MNDNHVLILKKEFPTLYKHINFIECGDGWYSLIYNLSEILSKVQPDLEAHQIKEKFGTLRFYTSPHNSVAANNINRAENLSAEICEHCGEPGVLKNDGGWLRTVCDKHSKNRS